MALPLQHLFTPLPTFSLDTLCPLPNWTANERTSVLLQQINVGNTDVSRFPPTITRQLVMPILLPFFLLSLLWSADARSLLREITIGDVFHVVCIITTYTTVWMMVVGVRIASARTNEYQFIFSLVKSLLFNITNILISFSKRIQY